MLEVKFALNWNYKGQRGKETLFHTAVGSFMTAMRDWAPAFRAMVDEVLEPGVEEQFSTAGHGTWASLAPETVKQKGHDTILFDTGRLFRSFQRGGADHVEEIDRQSLRWGSRVPHALFHQTGTGSGFQQVAKSPGRGMPMRKILELSNAQKRTMRSILVQRLATIARREGFRVTGSGGDPLQARQIGQRMLGL